MGKNKNSGKNKLLPRMADFILMDLDNTIYEYEPCHVKALGKTAAYLRKTIGWKKKDFFESYDKIRREIHERLGDTASSHNRLLYFQRLLEAKSLPHKLSLALKLYQLYWDTFIGSIKVFEHVREFLDYAKKLRIPVAFITDMTADVQFKKLKRLHLEQAVDFVVTSEEAGADKPARVILDLALSKISKKPGLVWMIGDDVKDVDGGRLIDAVTFLKVPDKGARTASPAYRADVVFRNFHELIVMMKSIEKNRHDGS